VPEPERGPAHRAQPAPRGPQVLVDADNLDVGRLQLIAPELAGVLRVVVAGHPARLARVPWPVGADVRPAGGWQGADAMLAEAYVPDDEPLVLVTGDGDFALLAQRHPGPVLVVGVSGATSGRLRRGDGVTVVDPVHDGLERLRAWLSPG
jgi:hypothetical protein